ncbi:MAG: hypothetical protein LRY51_02405 [Geovibrio sp.]|nr:hypothetical protein [Geovibrio sp.]
MAQEGDPAVGMEMTEMLMEKGFESGLYYSNLYQNIAYGLQGMKRKIPDTGEVFTKLN